MKPEVLTLIKTELKLWRVVYLIVGCGVCNLRLWSQGRVHVFPVNSDRTHDGSVLWRNFEGFPYVLTKFTWRWGFVGCSRSTTLLGRSRALPRRPILFVRRPFGMSCGWSHGGCMLAVCSIQISTIFLRWAVGSVQVDWESGRLPTVSTYIGPLLTWKRTKKFHKIRDWILSCLVIETKYWILATSIHLTVKPDKFKTCSNP